MVIIVVLGLYVLLSAAFLLLPALQKLALRVVLAHYGMPVSVSYEGATLVPGHIAFFGVRLGYRGDGASASFCADTVDIRYIWGKPILVSRLRVVRPRLSWQADGAGGAPKLPKLPQATIELVELVDGSAKVGAAEVESLSFRGAIRIDEDGEAVLSVDSAGFAWRGRGRVAAAQGTLRTQRDLVSAKLRLALDSSNVQIKLLRLDPSSGLFQRLVLWGDTVNMTEVGRLSDLTFFEGNGKVRFDIRHTSSDRYEMLITGRGTFWGIPMSAESMLVVYRCSSGVLRLFAPRGSLWGAAVKNADATFRTREEPMRYTMHLKDVSDFDLRNFAPIPTKLCGEVTVEGAGFGEDMQMELRGRLRKGTLAAYDFDSAAVAARVSRKGAEASQTEPVVLFAGENRIELWGSALTSGAVDIHAKGRINDPAKLLALKGIRGNYALSAHIVGNGRKLGVRFKIEGEGCKIADVKLGRLNVSGQFTDVSGREGTVIALAEGGSWGKVPIDTLYLSARFSRNRVFFRPLRVRSGVRTLRAVGMLTAGQKPSLRVEGFAVEMPGASVNLLKATTFNLSGGVFASGIPMGAFDGRMDIDTFAAARGVITVKGGVDGLSLQKLSALLGLPRAAGTANGHFELEIDLANLEGEGFAALSASPLALFGLSWSSMRAEARLKGDTIFVRTFHLRRPSEEAVAKGYITLRGGAVELDAFANGEKLDLLSNLIGVEALRGSYRANVNASGTIDSIRLVGRFEVESAAVKINPLDNTISDINITGTIDGNKLHLERLEAKTSATPPGGGGFFAKLWALVAGQPHISGKFTGSGTIDIANLRHPKTDLVLCLKDFPLKSTTKGFYAVLGGTLNVVGAPPAVGGQITITEGNILKIGSATPGKLALPLKGDVALTLENIWLLSNQLEAKIGGELLVSSSKAGIALLGELSIADGQYFLYGQRFRIERGVLTFDKISVIDPKLDIDASTNFGSEELVLHISGKLSEPQVQITSTSPDFTQDDILRMLAGTSDTVGFARALEKRTRSFLQEYIERNIELLARKTLGVDELELEPAGEEASLLRPSQMRLTVGKRVGRKLFLRYSQVLSEDPRQTIELVYKLSGHFSIAALEDEDKNYRLKLDLRWEY